MADFTQIIQEINEDITTNGVGAITGAKLNEVLRDMIAAVNAAKQDPLIIDTIPTEDSTNAVQSGGVYDALEDKLDKEELYIRLGFPIFDASLYYAQGDVVVYNGDLYVFTADHHGQWDADDVEPHDIYKELKDLYVDLAEQIDAKQDTISDLATIRSGAALGATAYQKPSGGIPKTDLASGVQTSLGKADTAVQPSSLATVATSGSYNDLLNKPTIPAAQVQSDWNEADNTKVDYIKNKPTIPDVSGKADKVVGATSGDVATLDSNGNLTDSGLSVFDFFVMVEDASTPPASMAPNTVYQYGALSGNTTFPPLATPTEPDIANVYCWTFSTPSTAPTITWPTAITSWAGGSAPTINASKTYEVSVMDGLATIIEA